MRRFLVGLLIILVVLYGAGELYAKKYAEGKVEEQVRERYPAAREVDATVSAPIVFGLIAGSKVGRVEVAVGHVDAGEFFTDRVTALLTGVHVDMGESVSKRKLVVDSVERLDLTIEISEEEASKTLPTGFAFDFQDGTVLVTGPRGISIEGKFEVRQHEVNFVPDRLALLPRAFQPPTWGLKALPMASCLREIQVLPARVKITCSINNPPARFPPEPSGLPPKG